MWGPIEVLFPNYVFVLLLLDVNLMGNTDSYEGCMEFLGSGLGFLVIVCSCLKNIKKERE